MKKSLLFALAATALTVPAYADDHKGMSKAEHDKILAEVKDEAMVYTADKMTSLFTIKPNKGTPILIDRGVYIPGSIIVDDKYVMPEVSDGE